MGTAGGNAATRIGWVCFSGSVMMLLTYLSGCKETLSPETVDRGEAQPMSPEKQAYLEALKGYNDFVEHPKGHVYNVYPKEQGLELCYLSAQVVIAAVKVPEFAADRNPDGEIKEWRRWIDIREQQLHC